MNLGLGLWGLGSTSESGRTWVQLKLKLLSRIAHKVRLNPMGHRDLRWRSSALKESVLESVSWVTPPWRWRYGVREVVRSS